MQLPSPYGICAAPAHTGHVVIHIIDVISVRITKGTYTEARLRGSSREEGRPTLHVDSIIHGLGPWTEQKESGLSSNHLHVFLLPGYDAV